MYNMHACIAIFLTFGLKKTRIATDTIYTYAKLNICIERHISHIKASVCISY